MSASTHPIRLLGDRQPEAIRTGAPFWSAGDYQMFGAGYGPNDCQAIDAPYGVPSGGMRVIDWLASRTNERVGVTTHAARRGVAA